MKLFLMGVITCLLILAAILFVMVNLGYEIIINGTQRKKDRLNKYDCNRVKDACPESIRIGRLVLLIPKRYINGRKH